MKLSHIIDKKILYISPGYNPVRKIPLRYMFDKYGVNFVFVSALRSSHRLEILPPNTYYLLNMSGGRLRHLSILEVFVLLTKLFSIIQKGKYDVVISSTQHSLHSKFAFIICKILKKEYYVRVETWYDYSSSFPMFVYHKLADFITKKANSCFVNGQAAREYLLRKEIDSRNIMILPFTTGDPLQIIDSNSGFDYKKRGINLVFAGRLEKIKGIDVLIKAFSIVLSKYPKARLTIIGDGSERRALSFLSKREKVDKSISFIGWLNHKDLLNYIHKHQIFVLPSIEHKKQKEGFGLVLLEAVGLGIAVISTDAVGASCDLVIDDYNGYTVKNNSILELAHAIQKVIPRFKQMGSNSRKVFIQYEKIFDKTLQRIACKK